METVGQTLSSWKNIGKLDIMNNSLERADSLVRVTSICRRDLFTGIKVHVKWALDSLPFSVNGGWISSISSDGLEYEIKKKVLGKEIVLHMRAVDATRAGERV